MKLNGAAQRHIAASALRAAAAAVQLWQNAAQWLANSAHGAGGVAAWRDLMPASQHQPCSQRSCLGLWPSWLCNSYKLSGAHGVAVLASALWQLAFGSEHQYLA
jgi:asparagine N-glycosylation enzyme membrane subunit Stt3